ncbi:MAG: ATP-dependent DNA helicase [Spirochaetaceae bacterium]|jgi:ATP-dependent DNA helicase DinG|nr:ATP-dependent DNA helicase [Spirochaetaceae bacterium]
MKIDSIAVGDYLSKNGAFAQRQGRFEERQSQMDLAVCVADAFNDDGIGVFEAGTGVGKSFAYLVPALLWQAKNDERVVISTGTINLQQQLMQKDIPEAMDIADRRTKAVLVKGRQQYLCLRRLRSALDEGDLFTEDAADLGAIASWAETTRDGSRSDAPFMPPQSLWSRINSESDGCMGPRCPFHDQCFVAAAREAAQDAGILVVNHHLLFADVETRLRNAGLGDAAVLPPYGRLILDEAHAVEEAATSFFSSELTRFRLLKQLNRLSFARGTQRAGALHRLEHFLPGSEPLGDILPALGSLRDALGVLDAAGLDALGVSHTQRLTPERQIQFEGVFSGLGRVNSALGEAASALGGLLAGLGEGESGDIPGLFEARIILRRLSEAQSFCKDFLGWEKRGDSVFWIEKNRLTGRAGGEEWFPRFVETPLEIAGRMNEGVFTPVKTVICTSATLKTGGSFAYWMGRVGLDRADKGRVTAAEFPSPFPYAANVLLAVPADSPSPQEEGFQDYIDRTIPALIEAASGRTLALFTSYDQLRRSWESASLRLGSRFTLLKQGDDDRSRLLERFKGDLGSVLFATDSFWTGVDVPGESLSQVIIVKLPFNVPTDPVTQARCEAIEHRGGSPFMELSVPDAVIKFRQGFGRLLRHSQDRGVIAVLDRRIIQKFYGRFFLEAVPGTKRFTGPTDAMIQAAARFINTCPR